MKIGLLLPANIYFCPYVEIYIHILKRNNIEYDIFYWDKDGINEEAAFQFKYTIHTKAGKLKKLIGYIAYIQYLKKNLKKNRYSKLIVFGPQIGIFLFAFLKKYYFKSFIFDYRDLSIEQSFKRKFKKLLFVSSLNVISSPGFKRCLPDNFNYILSHNFNIDIFKSEIENKRIEKINQNEQVVILTIGAIRDFEQNIEIIKALSNDNRYKIRFVGKGPASDKLYDFVKHNIISNVELIGFYKKEQEYSYIKDASFMNIYYPYKLSHNTALSNRFYNALIHGKPMITTKNTVQGDYVEKYNLGIAIENTDNLKGKINFYIDGFNAAEYKTNRLQLLNEFINDYINFEMNINSILNQ